MAKWKYAACICCKIARSLVTRGGEKHMQNKKCIAWQEDVREFTEK